MAKYKCVPNIISGKDLDYISDMFEWNYGAYKSTVNSISKVKDEEIKCILNEATLLFKSNMKQLLSILGGKHE